MRLLTNGRVMVMILGKEDKVLTLPIPLFPEYVSSKMRWEKQNPAYGSLNDIKRTWPYVFDPKNISFVSGLKFVKINLQMYQVAYANYTDGMAQRPHFMDYASEMTKADLPPLRLDDGNRQRKDELDERLLD